MTKKPAKPAGKGVKAQAVQPQRAVPKPDNPRHWEDFNGLLSNAILGRKVDAG